MEGRDGRTGSVFLWRDQRLRHLRLSRLGLGARAEGVAMIELPHAFLPVLFASLLVVAQWRRMTRA